MTGALGAGECVRILTGAAVPKGANAVVMQEYAREEGEFVVFEQAAKVGQYFVHAGAEARVGEVVIARGTRLGYAELAMAAEVGRVQRVGVPAPARRDSFHRRRSGGSRPDAGPIPDPEQQHDFAGRAGDAGRRRAGAALERPGRNG